MENQDTKTKKKTTKKTEVNSTKSVAKGAKKASSTTKKTTTRTTTTKKATTKKAPAKKTATKSTTKTTRNSKNTNSTKSKSTSKKSNVEKKSKDFIIEYYDLPYRYNQTIVKILAQTPTTLFVYWDISDEDRQNYINSYGEDFFNYTKPYLIVHNITKNTSYEIEINDFANSWYLRTEEPDCKYEILLGRRKIKNLNDTTIPQNFIYVTSSNKLDTPNNHILLENVFSNSPVTFKNVKTNSISHSTYGNLKFMPNMSKLYNTHKFYESIYKEELFIYNNHHTISNPSSSY